MKDPYQVREHENNEVLRVEYTRPKFWHRCMANFVDFFIMLATFLGLFIGIRAIVQNTPSYKETLSRLGQLQIQSGLYVDSEEGQTATKNMDLIYYCDTYLGSYGKYYDINEEITDPKTKNAYVIKGLQKFLAFCGDSNNCPPERYAELLTYFDEARLTPTLNDIHYYIKDADDKIIPNPTFADDASKSDEYYNYVFKPFIEKKALPFLSANVTEYRTLSKVDYNYLLFLELPVAYAVAGILTYLVPPLFFRRGRKTLGKALYHIGLIDGRVLSPTIPRFLARFAIFYFGELILSLFSFGIPYIISFSLMAFSKKKQGFPDYMLGLYEIDTSKANIYMDYVEAQLKNELHGKAIDFKMKERL